MKCTHCHCVLKLGNYASLKGSLYCKTHFIQVFCRKEMKEGEQVDCFVPFSFAERQRRGRKAREVGDEEEKRGERRRRERGFCVFLGEKKEEEAWKRAKRKREEESRRGGEARRGEA